MKRPVSLSRYIQDALNPYRWTISVVVSVLVSAVFSGLILYSRVSSDQQMLRAISPYLSTLVDSQDRPELLRVFHSIAETKDVEMVLVQDGMVLASSRSLAEMDRAFTPPHRVAEFFGVEFTPDRLYIRARLGQTGEYGSLIEVFIFTPLVRTVRPALWVAVFAFLISISISVVSALQMRKAVRAALEPMERLHQEIRGIGQKDALRSRPLPIRELEEIRQTIAGTRLALENATDRLAEERAKKLSAESYKRLIHDLHTPVAALRQNVRLLASVDTDDETKQEVAESVPRVADQILKQITSAKQNLDLQPTALRECDIRSCIESSVAQVTASWGQSRKNRLVLSLPSEPIVAAHDPDLLQRAIINLVGNAADAAQGQIQVTLERLSETAVSITVSDDGPGMEESDVALHLQGRGASSKEERQAFGLSSANHIVRSHGGRIIYRRSPDLGGASFEIRLGATV